MNKAHVPVSVQTLFSTASNMVVSKARLKLTLYYVLCPIGHHF